MPAVEEHADAGDLLGDLELGGDEARDQVDLVDFGDGEEKVRAFDHQDVELRLNAADQLGIALDHDSRIARW